MNNYSEYMWTARNWIIFISRGAFKKKKLIFLEITVYFQFLSAMKQNSFNDSHNDAFVSLIIWGVCSLDHTYLCWKYPPSPPTTAMFYK